MAIPPQPDQCRPGASGPDAPGPDLPERRPAEPDRFAPDRFAPDPPEPDQCVTDLPEPDALTPDALTPDPLMPDALVPPHGLAAFNAAPDDVAERALLGCLRSPRWARRLAAHRPYPDLAALLAAADEAAYDLSRDDLARALAAETAPWPRPGTHPGAYVPARTALSAAHAAYETRFGHVFVMHVEGLAPDEVLDQVLASIRRRLTHDQDEELVQSAEELRGLARARLAALVRGDAVPAPEPACPATGPGA